MEQGEFHRLVKLDRVPEGAITLEADAGERASLARRFGLPGIDSLRADVTFEPNGDNVDVRGKLTAAFRQRCAVSDEPFETTLEEPLSIRFVPALRTAAEDEEIEFASDEPDEIEYDGAAFDLGEAVAQSFGLALDPYATGPDANDARRDAGIVDENAPRGPFAALEALKKKP